MSYAEAQMHMVRVEPALEALASGQFVLIYDKDTREGETDLVLAAEHVSPSKIRQMRRDAGGLICMAIPRTLSDRIGVPFMTDIMESASSRYPLLSGLNPNDIPYGDKPSFSITLNHRSTFTGITDNDRALTIRELAQLVKKCADPTVSQEDLRRELTQNFRSPGHVHLLLAVDGRFPKRAGHTELSLALAEMAGISPATVVCEMLDNQTGNALSKQDAERYARERHLAFIEGKDIMEAFNGKL